MSHEIRLNDTFHKVALQQTIEGARLWLGEIDHAVSLHEKADGEYDLLIDGHAHRVNLVTAGDVIYLHAFGRSWELEVLDPLERAAAQGGSDANTALAPMPGMVVSLDVMPGDAVHKGQTLLIIESMKLETIITAWRDGVVETIELAVGNTFEKGAKLVSLVKEGGGQ